MATCEELDRPLALAAADISLLREISL